MSDFDFLALYVVPEDLWYIIPVRVALRQRSIQLTPSKESNPYHPYEEAWGLLRDATKRRKARSVTLHAVAEDFVGLGVDVVALLAAEEADSSLRSE